MLLPPESATNLRCHTLQEASLPAFSFSSQLLCPLSLRKPLSPLGNSEWMQTCLVAGCPWHAFRHTNPGVATNCRGKLGQFLFVHLLILSPAILRVMRTAVRQFFPRKGSLLSRVCGSFLPRFLRIFSSLVSSRLVVSIIIQHLSIPFSHQQLLEDSSLVFLSLVSLNHSHALVDLTWERLRAIRRETFQILLWQGQN